MDPMSKEELAKDLDECTRHVYRGYDGGSPTRTVYWKHKVSGAIIAKGRFDHAVQEVKTLVGLPASFSGEDAFQLCSHGEDSEARLG